MATDTEKTRQYEQRLEAFWEKAKPLKKYIDEEFVEEVAVNHLFEVAILKHGDWDLREDPAISWEFMESLGAQLSNLTNKPFDAENTSLSTWLPNGQRVEMTHPPTSPNGLIYLNIRIPNSVTIPHSELIQQGYYSAVRHDFNIKLSDKKRKKLLPFLTEDEQTLWALAQEGKWAEFVELAVDLEQNIVVSGATGSGKTSYCRSLVDLIDEKTRIITVEDTPEMPMQKHRNNQRLFYKKHEGDPLGSTAKDTLHSVMRKTPKRVMMAELRGDEAMFYLSSVLSSGHPGGITTTHANSPKDAFFRLSLLILSSDVGRSLDMQTVGMLLHMTVNVVIQIDNKKGQGRRISGIYYDPMYRLSILG